jgi:hypothetical protein
MHKINLFVPKNVSTAHYRSHLISLMNMHRSVCFLLNINVSSLTLWSLSLNCLRIIILIFCKKHPFSLINDILHFSFGLWAGVISDFAPFPEFSLFSNIGHLDFVFHLLIQFICLILHWLILLSLNWKIPISTWRLRRNVLLFKDFVDWKYVAILIFDFSLTHVSEHVQEKVREVSLGSLILFVSLRLWPFIFEELVNFTITHFWLFIINCNCSFFYKMTY